MKAMIVLLVIAAASAAPHCPVNPMVGVEVTKDSTGYVLHFRSCVDSSQTFDVRRVTVTKGDGTKPGPLQCQISWKDFQQPSIKREWRYATKPAGYSMAKCDPLVAGETYVVRVSGAGGGSAIFSVAPDGSVRMSMQDCK